MRKSVLARAGANVEIIVGAQSAAQTGGPCGRLPMICRELYDMPDFDGARPAIGNGVVDGPPAGVGVREDGPTTGALSRFVPHIIHWSTFRKAGTGFRNQTRAKTRP